MFIKQIQVEKFKKLRDFKLVFPESKIMGLEKDKEMKLSVIIGENGTAKTTIFELIINGFLPIDRNIEMENFEVTYLLKGNEYNKKENNGINLEYPENIVISSYTPIDKLDNSKELGFSNSVFLQKTNINAQSIKKLATRLLMKYASNKFEEVYSILKYIGYEKREMHFEFSDYQLKNHYALDKVLKKLHIMNDEEYNFENVNLDLNVKDKIHNYVRTIDEFASRMRVRRRTISFEKRLNKTLTDISSNIRGIQNISFKGEHYAINALFILEKFSILINATKNIESNYKNGKRKLLSIVDINHYPGGNNQLLKDLKFLNLFSINILSDVWFENNYNDELFPLSMLSSGELSMFIRFFDLHEYVKDNSIVLIDEPETHLHPKWIRGYIKTLIDLLGDRKCHVIIATHSPLIISDVTKNCIIGLKKEDYYIKQVKIDDKTLGLNYEEVLSEIFNLEDQKGKMIDEYVDLIEKLLEYEDFEKALKIYSQIGNSEVKYQLFLKLKAYKESKGDGNV
ncbi:ATP-binding protein [Fictibacillus barbaricus]|uniref:AAA family ATPase n=1 Tax=Fictibacillus barbaricus TaxID=182136 RepID=A0ABS2ZES7_9BACL|nr:ATP-binding protein [Fictibacillus barbaricus]MBN3546698.1 AAA family ATPase [Fictibacillus barbaricus]GGB43103.1 hypothetical protein GCM10007199_05520 [Fictibacillus barbaricus]